MKLWHNKWDRELKTGDIVETHDGSRWYLFGSHEPRPNDPEGAVLLHKLHDNGLFRNLFPRAIGAEWRES